MIPNAYKQPVVYKSCRVTIVEGHVFPSPYKDRPNVNRCYYGRNLITAFGIKNVEPSVLLSEIAKAYRELYTETIDYNNLNYQIF
jgi:hypothetical protein